MTLGSLDRVSECLGRIRAVVHRDSDIAHMLDDADELIRNHHCELAMAGEVQTESEIATGPSFDDPCTPDAVCEAGQSCDHHAPLHAPTAIRMAPGDLLGTAHFVRVMWSEDPTPCFRLVFLEKLTREQWADEGGWTADRLRVKARELVARGLKVEPVDCPANVAVYYDQAAVERLTARDAA